MDIKETKEIIAAMGEGAVTGKKLVVVVKKILENGVNPADLIHLAELRDAMPDTAVIMAGVNDADVALEELKDLDQSELIEIIGELYKEAKRFNEA